MYRISEVWYHITHNGGVLITFDKTKARGRPTISQVLLRSAERDSTHQLILACYTTGGTFRPTPNGWYWKRS